ncbi:MAG: hypothetical protein JO316_20465 [Abitibacteriaceae bacterium]|nr:hypothetical protein [Abditibacteriaceae bacterium]
MAITIDLLPGYVGLKRWFKRLLAACIVLVAAVAGVLFAIYYHNQQILQKYKNDADAIEPYAAKAETAQAAAAAATSQAAPMQTAINFMSDASKTGPERAALLNLVRSYIYYQSRSGAIVNSMDLSDGQNLKLSVTLRTPDDYSRFLTNLRRGAKENNGPLFDGLPTASGVPGFPPPRESYSNGANGQNGAQGGPGARGQGAAILPGEPLIMVLPLGVNAQGKLLHPVPALNNPLTGSSLWAAGGTGGGSGGSGGYPGSGR